MAIVPFNRPHITGREFDYIREAIGRAHLASDGQFSRRCEEWLADTVGCRRALLTQSCTAALEMAALVAGIQPGDEVIMPSFTFVSTANAFLLRGATPVFVDILPDVLTLDPDRVEAAVSPQTRVIVPVHYAGVGARVERKVCVLHGRVAYQAAWANRTHSSCSRRTWTIRWRSSGAQFAYVR